MKHLTKYANQDKQHPLWVFVISIFFLWQSTACAEDLTGDLNRLFQDSVRFYSQELRNPDTGQYFDAIDLNGSPSQSSSVAATGMGLVSLAIGDASSTIPNAYAQALKSLQFLDTTKRSKHGWFRHWFEAKTGNDNSGSLLDGYSIIDSAILVAGAQIAANYFESKNLDENQQLRKLADKILLEIDWASAIANLNRGKLYLKFDLKNETAQGSTSVFNEYLIVACMGASAEAKRGKPSKMSAFWNQHYKSPKNLPKKSFRGFDLLTDNSNQYISNFAIQFTYYLCGDVNHSAEYKKYFDNARKADQLWFSMFLPNKEFWGLGAGEVRHRAGDTIVAKYEANSFQKNAKLMLSAPIIAGFLPVYPDASKDILKLYQDQRCLYTRKDYRLLWRCSLYDLQLPVSRLQAIDFSTMFLGLATLHPAIGTQFYEKFSAQTNTLP